jgi:hypothetical protein
VDGRHPDRPKPFRHRLVSGDHRRHRVGHPAPQATESIASITETARHAHHRHARPTGLRGELRPKRPFDKDHGPRPRVGPQRREGPRVVHWPSAGDQPSTCRPLGPRRHPRRLFDPGVGVGGQQHRAVQHRDQRLGGADLAHARGVHPDRTGRHRHDVQAKPHTPILGCATQPQGPHGQAHNGRNGENRGGQPRTESTHDTWISPLGRHDYRAPAPPAASRSLTGRSRYASQSPTCRPARSRAFNGGSASRFG